MGVEASETWNPRFLRMFQIHGTILVAKYKVRTLGSIELDAEPGWFLSDQWREMPERHRITEAMAQLSLGERPYP